MGYYKDSPKYKDTISLLIREFGEIRLYTDMLQPQMVIYGRGEEALNVLLNITDEDVMYSYIHDFVELCWYKKHEKDYVSYKR